MPCPSTTGYGVPDGAGEPPRTLQPSDLMPLATFERARSRLQAEAQRQREDRAVPMGPDATLVFESEITVRFRLQEILRHEAISGDAAVQAEIDVYAPLIPDGSNLKATFRLDCGDAGERALRLEQVRGVENYVWMQVEGSPRTYAIAERDTDLGDADRDAALHYLRFELRPVDVRALRQGRSLSFGIDHPACKAAAQVGENVRQALLKDLH
jgi:glycerol-3-phosphate dehydrogenase subunit C